jgi:microtubule-associated protein-like 6
LCDELCQSSFKFTAIYSYLVILSSYDFDGTGALNSEETTLALKSVALGLSKLTGCPERRDEEVEHLVSSVFRDIPEAELTHDTGSAQINIIVEHLTRHPDIISWYGCFVEQPQLGLQVLDKRFADTDNDKEGIVEPQSRPVVDAVDWKLSYEQMTHRARPAERSASDGIAWFNVSASLMPSEFANSDMPRSPPDVALSAEWVYGYQAEKAKNNLRYTKNGQIVYHNGPYAIQYDFDSHKQTIFTGHTNEILCLAVHPDRLFIATGEKGTAPKLLVWNAISMQVLFSDVGFHQNGVNHLTFSKDGTLLASCGMDFEHCIAVHDWQKGELLFTSRSNRGKCLGLTFLNTGAVANCGDAYVNFWMKTSEGYVKRRGNFSRLSPVQAQTCISAIGSEDSVVTGTSSGEIFLWTDRNCVRTVKGHKGGVVSIYASMFGVLTGGKDFRIRLWTHKLEPGAIFNLASFGHNPIIRSVCMSPDGASILVGTKACEIYEISSVDGSDLRGGLITSAHSSGCLRGLAMHPKRNEFASVGDDKKLRIWDMNTKTLLKVATFETEVRCVAYAPLGDVLAVGLGGEEGHRKTGGFAIINEDDLSLVHEAKDSNKPVNVVSFSGDGETLAIGSDDGAIYLYAVQDEYEMVGRCVRHSGPVIHIDFSVDGEWIRTNSSNGELCFFNADNASFQSNAAAMRDVQWSTQTCVYSWHTRGIHRTPFTGEMINKLQAPCALDMAKYLIGATNYGYLKTFCFPCVPDESSYYRAFAHAGSIASTIFSYDAERFITAGLTDRTIVQWKVRMPVEMPKPEPDPEAEEAKAEGAAADGQAAEAAPAPKEEIRAQIDNGSDSEDLVLEARDGETFLNEFYVREASAVTSIINGAAFDPNVFHEDMNLWSESVIAPTNPPPLDVAVPDMSLRLEYAYGYRCQDMRNNVRYTDNENEISFVAASVGVVMNKSSKAQNFYQVHMPPMI